LDLPAPTLGPARVTRRPICTGLLITGIRRITTRRRITIHRRSSSDPSSFRATPAIIAISEAATVSEVATVAEMTGAFLGSGITRGYPKEIPMKTLRLSLSNAALLTGLGLGMCACEASAPYQTAYDDWPGYHGGLRDSDDDRDRSRKDKAHSDKGYSGKAHGGHKSGGRSGGKSGGKSGGDRPK
jgi:hypothetical protein